MPCVSPPDRGEYASSESEFSSLTIADVQFLGRMAVFTGHLFDFVVLVFVFVCLWGLRTVLLRSEGLLGAPSLLMSFSKLACEACLCQPCLLGRRRSLVNYYCCYC